MTRRVPEVSEVVYVRAVVTRILEPFAKGDPPTVVLRPLSERNHLGHFDMGGAQGAMVELHSIVFPKDRTRHRPQE